MYIHILSEDGTVILLQKGLLTWEMLPPYNPE